MKTAFFFWLLLLSSLHTLGHSATPDVALSDLSLMLPIAVHKKALHVQRRVVAYNGCFEW